MVQTGLEVFLQKQYRKYQGMRLGVLCNQASVNIKLRHISELLTDKKLKLQVTSFFGPQHGIRGEKQDNMIESQDFTDPITRLPVYSLYGDTREPTAKMFSNLDALIIDLQDVGTRIYTFMYTMANCMRKAREFGKKIIVLDRPNPINGLSTEGNVLRSEFTSFVGQYSICVRPGMTMGELAKLFNEAFGIGCDLEIVRMKGWKRSDFTESWKRDWVPPSPNVPNPTSVLVFPGMVLFEGTNVSEGRGTTKPFEWIGAPYIDPDKLAVVMNAKKLPGVYWRPIFFQPTYQKGKDQVCGGVQVHIVDRKRFNAFSAGAHLLHSIAGLYPKDFQWKKPPYEYEHTRMPIDLIAGTDTFRKAVEAGKGLEDFEEESTHELAEFRKTRKKFLLYK